MTEYSAFLSAHTSKTSLDTKGQITHTRIGNKEANIHGGSYIIPSNELGTFWELYRNKVFVLKHNEYLTERQGKDALAFAIDLDFRYSPDITSRQHNSEMVAQIVNAYVDQLRMFYQFTDETKFSVFVFEKPNVNTTSVEGVTKDGIHIIIGLKVPYKIQLSIRQALMQDENLPTILKDLPLTNKIGDVLDEGISKGTTNWQLYGSKKPLNEAYELTYVFKFKNNSCQPHQTNLKDYEGDKFNLLSVQYPGHPALELLEAGKQVLDAKPQKPKAEPRMTSEATEPAETHTVYKMTEIDYYVKFGIEYGMFKQMTGHNTWVKIGYAIAHELQTNYERAEYLFVELSRDDVKFDEDKVKTMFQKLYDNVKLGLCETPVTIATLIHYFKETNLELAMEIIREVKQRMNPSKLSCEEEMRINNFVNELINKHNVSDADYAEAFVKCFGRDHKLIDVKSKQFYNFIRTKDGKLVNLWELQHGGATIREKISNEFVAPFEAQIERSQDTIAELAKQLKDAKTDADKELTNGAIAHEKSRLKHINECIAKCKNTSSKNKIFSPICDKIEDVHFAKDMNTQKDTLPIKGCQVFNMKTNTCEPRTEKHKFNYECNASWIDLTVEQEKEMRDYFMGLFCNDDKLMQCVLDIIKSCFTGKLTRHIFFLTGCGSNGKSVLLNLLNKIFSNAMDAVDTSVILETRASSALTTQYEKLNKCRVGYITELEEEDKLNVKNIKKISGGDKIDFRGLFVTNQTIAPTSNLWVCTNELPRFNVAQAIMDRIIIIPFNNRFKKDIGFEDKMMEKLDELFSFIMKNGRCVNEFECTQEMLQAKQEYAAANDHLATFINERIQVSEIAQGTKINNENSMTSSGFAAAFELWRNQNSIKTAYSATKISKAIKDYKINKKESNGKTWYIGCTLKDEDADNEPDEE